MSSVFLDPKVKLFLDQTNTNLYNAVSDKALLKQQVVNQEEAKAVALIAFRSFQVNRRTAERKSMAAYVSGLLGSATLGAALFNQFKGRKLSGPLLSIAVAAGVGLMTLWLIFRNCDYKLTVKAEEALKNGDEDQVIELIAQGANPRQLNASLNKITNKENLKIWLYLVFLQSSGGQFLKDDMPRNFKETSSIAKAKAAVELGALSLTDIYGDLALSPIKITPQKAELAIDLGFNPNEVLSLAKDPATVKVAVGRGAIVKNPDIYSLFIEACRALDNEFIAFLIQHGATTVAFDIFDYEQWDVDCALSNEKKQDLIVQEKYHHYQLFSETPFECYLNAYFKIHDTLTQTELFKIFKLFRPDKNFDFTDFRVSNFLTFSNDYGIRIRQSECQKLFDKIDSTQ